MLGPVAAGRIFLSLLGNNLEASYGQDVGLTVERPHPGAVGALKPSS
ncbi:MAG TPA: hypothetical protein VMI09_12840 [Candidatus Binataceae bacterium]|nr:hypothetical protein [Candidatus Binataceae bacterium]